MKLIIINEGTWKKGKYGDGNNRRITFKNLDESIKDYYYLNVTDYEIDVNSKMKIEFKWMPYCKKGNILDVSLLKDNIINKFSPFMVIKMQKEQVHVRN